MLKTFGLDRIDAPSTKIDQVSALMIFCLFYLGEDGTQSQWELPGSCFYTAQV